MCDVEGTIDPAGVLGFLWNDCTYTKEGTKFRLDVATNRRGRLDPRMSQNTNYCIYVRAALAFVLSMLFALRNTLEYTFNIRIPIIVESLTRPHQEKRSLLPTS